MKVFIPPNLNFEALIKEYPPPPHTNQRFKFDVDDLKYIISTIISIKAGYKDYHDEEYVPVNAQALQSRVREYNYYIDYLLNAGVIEVKNKGQYIVGERSRSYKLSDRYAHEEFALDEVSNVSLISKRKKQEEAENALNAEYGYLTKWFNDKLQVNEKMAFGELMRLLMVEKGAVGGIHKRIKGKATPWERYQYRLQSLKMLQNGMYHLSVDKNVRRFHSNLTNLKSELRQFITYDSKRLCSIDVKNCQPFISTVFFNPEFYQPVGGVFNLQNLSPSIYEKMRKELPTILSILSNFHITSLIMLVKDDEEACTNDIELYCTLVDKGRLYSYFSKKYFVQTGIKLDVAIPEQKRQLKDGLFASFFSDNRFFGQPEAEMKRFFAELFPNVYKVFTLIKKGGRKAYLPVILQLIESEVVVRRAALRIAELHPNLPIFTIHDSIVTLDEYKEMVRRVLKDEFHRTIGLMPNLNPEPWGGK